MLSAHRTSYETMLSDLRNKRMWLNLAIQCAFLSHFGRASLSSTKVTIDNGGYKGLVIAIHPDVAEDEGLINYIKASWTNASRDLFVSTGNRAYFKQIIILLPKTWNASSYDRATGSENFDQADVVITSPNATFGNEPYTEQYGGCGERGIRTHFTPTYFADEEYVENYGARGKVILHEWAHYRWGVFDETSATDPFYWDPEYGPNMGPMATKCPRDLHGNILNVESNYERCSLYDINEETNTYPKNCVFFPGEQQHNPISTSVMAYQYLDTVNTFCKDAVDAGPDIHNVHNVYAPNSQNRLCGMQSVWSVIKASPDYPQWSVLTEGTDTDPVFYVVQPQQDQRFVLILDDSGSMGTDDCSGKTRTECLKTAASLFIEDYVPDNSYVGVVRFGTDGHVMNYLTLLQSDKDREALLNSIEKLDSGSGGTCIGCGINAGIEVLEYGGQSAAGGSLIVITDGEETTSPFVSEVRDEVLHKNIIVQNIFITNSGNEDLRNLSLETGGTAYSGDSQSELMNIFSQISTVDSTADNTFQMHSTSFTVDTNIGFNSSVFIDSTVGLNTIFTFTWSLGGTPPNIHITSPSMCLYSNYPATGTMCPHGSSSHTENLAFSTIKFAIPGVAEVGEWTYFVDEQPTTGEITSSVTSEASSSDVQPIIIESGMGETEIKDGAAIVYAKISKGYIPILNAEVVAKVTVTGAEPRYVDLYDNGAGCDIREDDGVYSRYFTEFTGAGRYGVEISIRNRGQTGQTRGMNRETTSKANYKPGVISADGSVSVNPNGVRSTEGNSLSNGGVQSHSLGQFSRIASAGSFDYTGTVDVTSSTPAPDTFPPGKITDLKIRQKDLENFEEGIVVQFTASGNDFDQGRASGYDFRYTYDDPTALIVDFVNCKTINESHVIEGNMSNPASAGDLEDFVVKAPELPVDAAGETLNNTRFAFAVRAYDSDMNFADPSNVAAVNFFIASLVLPTATTAAAVIDTTVPAVDTTAPAVDTSAPAVDTTVPAVDTTAPAVDTTAPAVDTTAPSVGTTALTINTSTPTITTPASTSKTLASTMKTSTPTIITPASTSTIKTTKHSTTKQTPSTCKECAACESSSSLMWAVVGLGVTTAIFLTLSIVLAISLAKANCVLQKRDDLQARVVENKTHQMAAWDTSARKQSMTRVDSHFHY